MIAVAAGNISSKLLRKSLNKEAREAIINKIPGKTTGNLGRKGAKFALNGVNDAASKTWGGFFGKAGKSIMDNSFTEEGIERLITNSLTGAAWGAGIGGVTEWAQGGSLAEGAKRGAITGGMIGVAGTAVGTAARGFDSSASGFKGSKNTISKQLKAVRDNKANANMAKKNVTNKK